MGISDRKEREKEEMKTKILEAAKKLFLDKGFEKTSIRNIADLIEYSPGTIYLYFKDKNDLLFHLHQVAFQNLIVALVNPNPAKKAIDRLEDMGNRYIAFAYKNPEMYDLMFVMEAPIDCLDNADEIWDDGMRAFDLLKLLVTDCQKEGYLGEHELEDASLMVWSFVHGLVTLKCRKRLQMFGDDEQGTLERMMKSYRVFVETIKMTKTK